MRDEDDAEQEERRHALIITLQLYDGIHGINGAFGASSER